MKSVIYETKGRAREYCELAINLYSGCVHGCVYCYGAGVTHTDPKVFRNKVAPRVTPNEIEQSAVAMMNMGDRRPVLLCFVTDPYQPIPQSGLTRQAIARLHACGIPVNILTKGGLRASRDFDLLDAGDSFATTLTLIDQAEQKRWEENAATTEERIESLRLAHGLGIQTWVSLEPVIFPEQTQKLIMDTYYYVGHYKVGKLNYHSRAGEINWGNFGWRTKGILDGLGAKYYFKKDLLNAMGATASINTWDCKKGALV